MTRGPVFILVLLVLAVAPPARGDDFSLAVSGVHADSGYLHVSFRLSDPLPESDGHGPVSSTPAALAYTIELWRERSGWFDSLVSSRTYGYRLEFDHWRNLYRVVTPQNTQLEFTRRSVLVELLCRQDSVVAARETDMSGGREYYFAITARLTPIDITQLNEVEGWLSGEIRTGTRRGGILGIPKAVVGMLADLAGFGDRSVVVRSPLFRASEAGHGIATVP